MFINQGPSGSILNDGYRLGSKQKNESQVMITPPDLNEMNLQDGRETGTERLTYHGDKESMS